MAHFTIAFLYKKGVVTMKYSVRERNTCMTLYLNGKISREIQKITNIPASTIDSWITKYNWKQKEQEVQQKLAEKTVDDIAEFRTQMIQDLESQIECIQSDLKMCKNPTSDKLYNVLLEYQKLLLSLKGVQLTQSKTTVEHTGKIGIKLEDLIK